MDENIRDEITTILEHYLDEMYTVVAIAEMERWRELKSESVMDCYAGIRNDIKKRACTAIMDLFCSYKFRNDILN